MGSIRAWDKVTTATVELSHGWVCPTFSHVVVDFCPSVEFLSKNRVTLLVACILLFILGIQLLAFYASTAKTVNEIAPTLTDTFFICFTFKCHSSCKLKKGNKK